GFQNSNYHEPKASRSEQEKAEELFQLGVKANLLTVVGGSVQFYHQLLQEYFCARYLQTQPLTLLLLDRIGSGYYFNSNFEAVWPLWAVLDPLGQPEENRRESDILTWDIIGEEAVMTLITALQDPNEVVREIVTWTLGQIGDSRAVMPLIEALQ